MQILKLCEFWDSDRKIPHVPIYTPEKKNNWKRCFFERYSLQKKIRVDTHGILIIEKINGSCILANDYM